MIYCDKLRQFTMTSCDRPLWPRSTRHTTCCGDAVMATDSLAQENRPPGQKIGKRWRFHRDAVDEWLKKMGPEGQKILDEYYKRIAK